MIISPSGISYLTMSRSEIEAEQGKSAWQPCAKAAKSMLMIDEAKRVLEVANDGSKPKVIAESFEALLEWHARALASGEIAALSDGSLALLSQITSDGFEWRERELAPGPTAGLLEAKGQQVAARLISMGKIIGRVEKPRTLQLLALAERASHTAAAVEALEEDPGVEEFFFDEAELGEILR